MIEYLILTLSYPLGKILQDLTKNEKQTYTLKRYFPTIQIILILIAAISLFFSKQIFLTSIFSALTIHFWKK